MRYGTYQGQPVLFIGTCPHTTRALTLAALAMRTEIHRLYEYDRLAGVADLRKRIEAARTAIRTLEAMKP